ncbi:hypothetical protein [Urbanus proteus nucleopolyhedrovirus]|uniref:Uncharacterized protein n=1 Tax=Urbanus proteus nucleopolyhedrovirus TaxID=1675866 RepID=A0A161CCX7_9ABAC|nr:hypothetical protein [Urbanus proteus nucleopolyhedrovirus]AKR17291.1 hypothetical protein [Urbanus proteus nucleopolyhedrovirus]
MNCINVNDLVFVKIIKYNLHGWHEVVIVDNEQYKCVLIAPTSEVLYENLIVRAKIIRINDKSVDLILKK